MEDSDGDGVPDSLGKHIKRNFIAGVPYGPIISGYQIKKKRIDDYIWYIGDISHLLKVSQDLKVSGCFVH